MPSDPIFEHKGLAEIRTLGIFGMTEQGLNESNRMHMPLQSGAQYMQAVTRALSYI